MSFFMNRMANCRNEFQGRTKRVLCVCSAGLLRSPTAAVVLASEPFNFNTRACGIVPEYALIPLDEVLLKWADEVVCMQADHAETIAAIDHEKRVICLNIPDRFAYRNPELMEMIKVRYEASQQV